MKMKPDLIRIDDEVARLKEKYNPKTPEDLERIAREEYGVVNIVKTPLAS